MIKKCRNDGFTLMEVLIALFIFSIVSLLLSQGLHTVVNLQGDTEDKAKRLRNLQMGLLVMSRDIEQIVQRPICNASGKEEAAFIGTPDKFTFTHTGYTLQRVAYVFGDKGLMRLTWPVLDQVPKTKAAQRLFIDDVTEARFEYLDTQGRFQEKWPADNGEGAAILPRGVRITLTIKNWGSMTQFYLLTAEDRQADDPQPPSPP